MSSMRHFKSLNRKTETKTPKRKIIIYSEGEKTEVDYFNQMKREFRSVIVGVEIVGGAGVPLTIAGKAVQAAKDERNLNRRQSYAKNDEFWAVFDRDEHPHVSEAISACKDASVGVAFSNPCFELWLVLHFQEYGRPGHHHDVQKYLEHICSDYDRIKRKTTNCKNLMRSIVIAEERAERQLQRRNEEDDPLGDPSTTVYELTRRIRTR